MRRERGRAREKGRERLGPSEKQASNVERNTENVKGQKETPASIYLTKRALRPGDCKYRELIFKTEITDFFIFCQEKPFGKLFSKISLKLSREFLVELRFLRCGSNKFSRKLRHIHITLGEIRLGQLK